MSNVPRSLPRLCVALGFPTADELCKVAEREYKDGATFFEFRLDHLTDPAAGPELIRKFCRVYPDAHILATCRHRHARGGFSGSAEKQIAVLSASAEAGAAYIDLEIETAEVALPAATSLRKQASLIISYHNFESTPALDVILKRLRKVPADLYKVATTARKQTDNLRLFQFVQEHDQLSLIVLGMSEAGAPSRILSPSLGSIFTYAAPSGESGTAPGQIPAKTLRSLYRPEKLTKQSRVYGVVADPVSHSKSPFIHNRAFQARRTDAVYLPFLVNSGHLGDWMTFATKLPVAGFSVTIPHKRKIIRHLDTVDQLAKRIGAVNTVWRKAGKWRGTNTDVVGVLKPLSRHLRLAKSTVLIAGYGGAARAAAFALHDAQAKVTVTGRNMSEAQLLARAVGGEAISLKEARLRQFDVLVHATPVGMTPKTNECLFNDGLPARIVFDMVYNPAETLLLKQAKQQGCLTVPGADMLLEQAVSQFEIWTGESAPRNVMREALKQNL